MGNEFEACKSCPMAEAGYPERICQMCRTLGGTTEGKALANLVNGEYLRALIENTPIETIDKETGQVTPVYLGELLKKETSGDQFGQLVLQTQNVIDHFFEHKRHDGVKESTLTTYRKRLALFERTFPVLPTKTDTILKYLSQFDGKTNRTRRNNQDIIKMLFEHAVDHF